MLTKISPIEHFKELVAEAMLHQKVEAAEFTEFYLSTLLADFVTAEKLASEPLAATYLKALSSSGATQARMMKQLGDVSLFTSGFFSDSFNRKIIDVDYYAMMGAASYGHLAAVRRTGVDEPSITALFEELAAKFKLFMAVLSEVSERCRLTTSRDVLRVYERWLKTKSSQAERILRSIGIEPLEVSFSPVQ